MASIFPAADRVAKMCYDRFAELPKSGRPAPDTEWTVLTAILKYMPLVDDLEVVALGTGTKCLPQNLLSWTGDRLNDSHAEIMARRGFIRYLLHQMRLVKTGCDSIFTYNAETKRFSLCDSVSFHLFSTHPLCGDASIFERHDTENDDDDFGHKHCKKVRFNENNDDYQVSVGDLVHGFTGGKLVQTTIDCNTDTGTDLMVQQPGAVRTKPGRGIRTLSVSCSDKLSRWSLVGIQGALLHSLLSSGGVYLQSITMAGKCNLVALERAIWQRWSGKVLPKPNLAGCIMRPTVQKASESMHFECEQRYGRLPAPSSIVWCNVPDRYFKQNNIANTCVVNKVFYILFRNFEVAVAGKRQGVTKKQLLTKVGRLQICKVELLRQYQLLILSDYPEIGTSLGVTVLSTYEQCKLSSVEYTKACEQLKRSYFGCWTSKPSNINKFCCS